MQPLYPLRFQPLFRRYLWGGRRLGSVLGKAIGDGADYAESWEIVDHGSDQSRVAFGALRGTTLGELAASQANRLFGRNPPYGRFPLLLKFLDCNQNLSVQVHPNDALAALLQPPDLGKTEAWVILQADPGSRIYAGLKPGIDRSALRQAIERGRTEQCLHGFEPRGGDCVFVPAGTVHALGAGLLVAEIQQASDTTYRLFDWNRVGPDGRPRALHVEQALDCIDYERGPIQPQRPQPGRTADSELLVQCDKFVLERRCVAGRAEFGGEDQLSLLAVLRGQVSLAGDPAPRPLQLGDVALLPAACGVIGGDAAESTEVLEIFLP